nr:PREDICTED: A-agglutinin anchorage subunit-like [Bemisia tabaci]XP_018912366.1 PREDICTED: A-agglutinin anchorage subunit-like [Bemisia tabaci]
MATASQIDSDEEDVFWGPVTMKEIKLTFKKELEELNRRRSAEVKKTDADINNGTSYSLPKRLEDDHVSPVSHKSTFLNTQRSHPQSNGHTITNHGDPQPEEETCFASTPQKLVNISGNGTSQHNKESTFNSSSTTPISSPIKENCSSTYTTPSLASQSRNDFDSSFASVASSFIDESDSPALEVASESFEKVDPKRYDARSINIPDVIGSHIQSSVSPLLSITEKLNLQPSEKNSPENILQDIDSISNNSPVPVKGVLPTPIIESKIDKMSTSSTSLTTGNKVSQMNGVQNITSDCNLSDSSDKANHLSPKKELILGGGTAPQKFKSEDSQCVPCSAEEKVLNENVLSNVAKSRDLKMSSGSDSPASLKFHATDSPLKPFNISQFTEADLSDVSPPNFSVFDDSVMSVNQTQLPTLSKLKRTSEVPSRKLAGSNLPRFGLKLPQKKSIVNISVPKASVEQQNTNNFSNHLTSSKASTSPKVLRNLGTQIPSIVDTKTGLNQCLPCGEKTPQKSISTSGKKEKFFKTPPSIKYSNSKLKQAFGKTSPFNPKFDRLSPTSVHMSTPSFSESIVEKNGTCEKVVSEPKKKFFSGPHSLNLSTGPVRVKTPKIISPKSSSNSNTFKPHRFAKNDTLSSERNNSTVHSKIPAASIPRFFPRNVNITPSYRENVPNCSLKSEDLEISVAAYSSDSSLPLSEASFSSSNTVKTFGIAKSNTLSSERNNTSVRSKIPSASIPKFFPKVVTNTHPNQENLPNSTRKSEDFEKSVAFYGSDTSLPLSDASFNSSANSNKSRIGGIPKPKFFADLPKKQPTTRLPRLNDSSRIPKVSATNYFQKNGK